MAARPARPCLDCGALTRNGSRCQPHTQAQQQRRDQQRGTANARGYTRRWRSVAAQAIAEQPWCSDCGATTDLTGDHVVPRSRGGTADDGIIVRCRSCNSRRGNRAD